MTQAARKSAIALSCMLACISALPRFAAANTELRRAFGSWEAICETTSESRHLCHVVQTIVSDRDPDLKLTTVFAFDRTRQRFSMRIVTPSPMSEPEGIALQVDNDHLGVLRYARCDQVGCLAILDDATDVANAYLAGKNASYLVWRTPDKGTFLQVPLDGFEAAVSSTFSEFGSAIAPMGGLNTNDVWTIVSYSERNYGACNPVIRGAPILTNIMELSELSYIAAELKHCAKDKVVFGVLSTGASKTAAAEQQNILKQFAALGIEADRVVFKRTLVTDDADTLVSAYLTKPLSRISLAPPQKLGQFKGELVLKFQPDGRAMRLVKPFAYIDSQGVTWPVSAGTQVDGASIPHVFWSIIGAPFTGKYREASVIHDHYCSTRSRHWKAVHKVFLDGMLARGVDRIQAQLMYLAVYRFGPRWDFDVDACFCKGCPTCANPILKRVPGYKPEYKAADFQELRSKLMSGGFTLEELEDAADYQLNTEILKSR